MSIGMMEYQDREAELVALGVNSTSDIILARFNRAGVMRMNSFELKNKGKGDVTFTLKKRGKEYPITAEDIDSRQVGSSDRFKGTLAQRRVKPGTVVIVDANTGTIQRVEDTNSDGVLWQTDGPVGPTYPIQVGVVNYHDGTVDFTFQVAVTLSTVDAAYRHTNWTVFSTSVTFSIVKAGGYQHYQVKGDSARTANILSGMSIDEIEIGFAAKKKTVDDPETILGLVIHYHGNDEEVSLPIIKGEIGDYPHHNA